METPQGESSADEALSLRVYLDDATEPFATYRPPATMELDTATLEDGPHVLRIQARDALGNAGVRTIPFTVQNGPGITVTGLRPNERVSGPVELNLNAFSSSEPFDPVRAESSGPFPVWTWVMSALIAAWAGWYGLTEFQQPAVFARRSGAAIIDHERTSWGITHRSSARMTRSVRASADAARPARFVFW